MRNFMKFKTILVTGALLGASAQVAAQESAGNLSELLDLVAQDRVAESEEYRQRLSEFEQNANRQEEILDTTNDRIVEQENLQKNALVVGRHIRDGLRALQSEHELIGDVRGRGLFIGVELVTDREAKTPATAQAKTIVNAMKEKGVLISNIGMYDNVLKMRPPLPFSKDNADLLLAVLEEVLTQGSE